MMLDSGHVPPVQSFKFSDHRFINHFTPNKVIKSLIRKRVTEHSRILKKIHYYAEIAIKKEIIN